MLRTLDPHDSYSHQTTLHSAGKPAVSLLLEPLLEVNGRAGWEWMVWLVSGAFEEPETQWHGTEASFDEAKLSAMDAAIELANTISAQRSPEAVTSHHISSY